MCCASTPLTMSSSVHYLQIARTERVTAYRSTSITLFSVFLLLCPFYSCMDRLSRVFFPDPGRTSKHQTGPHYVQVLEQHGKINWNIKTVPKRKYSEYENILICMQPASGDNVRGARRGFRRVLIFVYSPNKSGEIHHSDRTCCRFDFHGCRISHLCLY